MDLSDYEVEDLHPDAETLLALWDLARSRPWRFRGEQVVGLFDFLSDSTKEEAIDGVLLLVFRTEPDEDGRDLSVALAGLVDGRAMKIGGEPFGLPEEGPP